MLFNFKKYKLYIILFIMCVIFYTAAHFDFYLYKTPVAEITSVKTALLTTKPVALAISADNSNTSVEKYYKQEIQAKIVSKSGKGQNVKLTNEYSSSMAYTDKLYKGMYIFLSKPQSGNANFQIIGIKRDSAVVLAFAILLAALIAIGKKQGLFTCISLMLNISVISLMLNFHSAGSDILPLSALSCLILCCLIIFLINGFSAVSLLVLAATLISIASITLLSAACIYFGKPLEYEFMEYLREPFEQSFANKLFLSQLLMGSTGVIIDICMSIVSFAIELLEKKPNISPRALIRSSAVISENITGTMINVVFFTNFAASFPIFIISLKNGVSAYTVIRYDLYFEAIRFFVGGIGILLAIPTSSFIAVIYANFRQNRNGHSPTSKGGA